jgi:hypothetical protein
VSLAESLLHYCEDDHLIFITGAVGVKDEGCDLEPRLPTTVGTKAGRRHSDHIAEELENDRVRIRGKGISCIMLYQPSNLLLPSHARNS